MEELLRGLGLSETAVSLDNITINQKTGELMADVEVREVVPYSAILRLKDQIARKTRMNVKWNIHFLLYDIIITEDNSEFIKDFLTTVCPFIRDFSMRFMNGKYAITLPYETYISFTERGYQQPAESTFLNLFQKELPVVFQCGEKPEPKEETQEPAGNAKKFYRKPKTEEGMLFGRKGTEKPIKISEIDFGRVAVIGEICSVSSRDIPKIESVSIHFTLTDYTDSVLCNIFEKAKAVADLELKQGMWVKVYGEYGVDSFSGDRRIRIKGIEPAENPYQRQDNCQQGKRVELHLHSQMSSMDSVLNISEMINLADKWGHPAIAITDHGVVQSFPEAYDAAKKKNIKVIYGLEGYLFDDKNQYIYNMDDNATIDDDIVVFDLETTGFYPGNDMITEIGAVKIQNGEITETFHTMVNPHKPISAEITQLTGITNEMVKDAPDVADALDSFYEFTGDAILSAHNAKFDTGFIYYFDKKRRFNAPVIDTLPIARKLLPNLRNHKLGTLVKHYGIVLENHHRADHDAKATGELLLKLLEEYRQLGKTTLKEINEWSVQGGNTFGGDTNHIILLAENKVGLHNLYELVSRSHLDYFYKKPRIPKSLLHKKREGLLLGTACEQGELYKAIIRNKSEEDIERIASFYDYLEIQPTGNNMFLIRKGQVRDIEELQSINKRIYQLGKKLNKPVVATCDAHFIEERDSVFRHILMVGQGFSDTESAPLYYRTTEEMLKEFSYLGEDIAREVVIENPNKIAEICNVDKPFPDEKTYTPSIDGAEEEITKLTYDRAHELYGESLPEIVEARIEKELRSINGYGFAVLYLIAQKLVKKSMDDGYLVGSRGSVGSSFVAFLTGITEVNPLQPHYICKHCKTAVFEVDTDKYPCGKDLPESVCPDCGKALYKDGYDIPFETFLGFKGDKVPDIDLNFSGEYQPQAHKYIEELFGQGHVFRAGTVNTLQDKTAFGFVKKYTEQFNMSVSPAEMNRLVSGCVGVKRTTGQHPGGIVIVPKDFDVYDFTPIQHPADSKDKGVITTHFDFNSMHDILVKVDALGHDDPTMLRLLQDLTGVDPVTIPLDDQETMSIFSSTEVLGVTEQDIGCKVGTFGIPEFGTTFVRQMLTETLPKTMAELVRISGLSHGTDVWVGNAQDLIKAKTVTLSEAICTRDDIMNMLIRYGVDSKTSFDVMELVRKGKGHKISEEQFAAMKEAKVPQWFMDSCLKIGYMFPKAHAAAYVMMAFRIAWFKVHRPEAYYAAYFYRGIDDFDAEKVKDGINSIEYNLSVYHNKSDLSVKDKSAVTILEVALEMHKRGFEFLPVDIYKSDASKFVIEDGKLRMPFRSIGGLGDAVASAILEQRVQSDFLSIDDLKQRTKVNKTTIDLMKNMGCLDGMSQSNQLSLF